MKTKFSFDFVVGVIAGFFYILNIALVSAIIFLLTPLGKWAPSKKIQKRMVSIIHQFIAIWTDINRMIMSFVINTRIEVDGTDGLDVNDWYLVTANHQSWVDTCVLYEVFNHKIPFLRFLAKQELLWLPFIGQSCWLLDFPLLKRCCKKSGKEKDLETTQKACEKFKLTPTAVMTFVEGTRYSPEKAQKQHSPYQHLLLPRAGGMALILSSLGEHIHQYLDVTIIYPEGHCTLWDFFCGRIKRIVVNVQKRPITPDFVGDYRNDPVFREKFQSMLNQLWKEKDEFISNILAAK